MQIKLNYQDTINKAKKLKEYSNDIKSVKTDLDSVAGSLSGGWKGNASDRYKKKLTQVGSKIDSRAKSLKTAANGIETSAKRLKKIDELGASIFGRH